MTDELLATVRLTIEVPLEKRFWEPDMSLTLWTIDAEYAAAGSFAVEWDGHCTGMELVSPDGSVLPVQVPEHWKALPPHERRPPLS